MKRIAILLAGISFALTGAAQTDSAKTENSDTIRVGNMIIIKSGDGNSHGNNNITFHNHHRNYKPSNITTNWCIVDIGFNQYTDNTNYSSSAIQDPVTGFAPGSNKDWFKLRTVQSTNFNIWFFM